ncbi:hypothetical protein [Actinoplanes siamensis]|uniref:Uncharacterized protein n=1 Tax=Actinoplanes siamensis TaxID=1223317 RepID=A0A919NCX9_9ACTN|nr:hypothetical protein [Actinoplanes siamensis]GIF08878.1 hypothetical protein Asi03nite_64160 [Actinoplanes siamensis]
MSARLAMRPMALATATTVALDEVPARIARRTTVLGLSICDVCSWPIHPVVLAGAQDGRLRHPGCVCCVCTAPLLREQLEPGVVWHPQCRRGARPVLTVIGGAAR